MSVTLFSFNIVHLISIIIPRVETFSCHGSQLFLFNRQMGETGDVLNLVDSDDEQMFQDAVPQLPPVTNGHRTTLVQIHRMPSSTCRVADDSVYVSRVRPNKSICLFVFI